MELKFGRLFWPQIYQGPVPDHSPLDRDIRCDVAVIGGGISGALVAYHLTRSGIHTVLVDRGEIARQSTAASTGLLQYEIDTPLVELISKLGQQRAVAAYRASVQATQAFEPLVDDLPDRCGLTARPSLFLASEEKDVDDLRAECKARRAMQIDVTFLSNETLRGELNISRPAALWSSLAFEVDPYRLTLQLIQRSLQRGLQVFTHTEIAAVHPEENSVTLQTAGGPKIEAQKIVFATGYEMMDFLPRNLCQLKSTYAIASQSLHDFPNWPQRCLIWESANPYLYARTTQDNRVIVGGEDVDTIDPKQRDGLLPEKIVTLRERFTKLMRDIEIEPAFGWVGTFGQTRDGLPYIGTLPSLPRVYFALGYGGNGITFSLLAAQIITDLFLGRDNRNAHLFGFDR